MVFAIDSEPLLAWMQGALITISLAVLLVWIWLFILRLIHERQDIQRRQLQQQWQTYLFQCCADAQANLPEQSQIQGLWKDTKAFLWFMQMWSVMHRYVRGDADDGLERLAKALQLEQQALRLMQGQDVRTLIATAIAMGDLQKLSPTTIKRLQQLTRHSSSMVVLTALRALMRNDQALAVPILLKLKSFVAPERLVTIAKECDSNYLIQEAQKALFQATPKRANYLFKVLQGVDVPISAEVAEHLAQHFKDHPETIAHFIPLLDHPHHLPLIRRFTHSSKVSVRVQATRVLAELAREQEDLDRLWQLLQDSVWWVRYRAAEGIFWHPKFSRKYLQEQWAERVDPYAKDMLLQVAHEMNLEGIDV